MKDRCSDVDVEVDVEVDVDDVDDVDNVDDADDRIFEFQCALLLLMSLLYSENGPIMLVTSIQQL